jgi:hypothetical protein
VLAGRGAGGLGRVLEAAAAARPGDACRLIAEHCRPMLQRKYDDWAERLDDIDSLCRIAENHATICAFLSELLVDAGVEPAGRPGPAPLTLSSIHSAKGLEWDVVHILGLSDGVFPDRRSFGDVQELEEERRLLYVAITRARRKLMLSTRGGTISRFLGAPGVRRCVSAVRVGVGPAAGHHRARASSPPVGAGKAAAGACGRAGSVGESSATAATRDKTSDLGCRRGSPFVDLLRRLYGLRKKLI